MIDKKIASPSLPHFSRCANISHLAINTLRLLLQSPGQISPAPYRFCLEQFPGWGRMLVKKERGELAPGCVCFHHHKCLNKTLPDSEKEREIKRHPSLFGPIPPHVSILYSIPLSVCTLSINNKASEEFDSPGVLSRPISFRKTQIVLASTAKEQ